MLVLWQKVECSRLNLKIYQVHRWLGIFSRDSLQLRLHLASPLVAILRDPCALRGSGEHLTKIAKIHHQGLDMARPQVCQCTKMERVEFA